MPSKVSKMRLQWDSTVYLDCHLHKLVVTYMRTNVSFNVLNEFGNMRKGD